MNAWNLVQLIWALSQDLSCEDDSAWAIVFCASSDQRSWLVLMDKSSGWMCWGCISCSSVAFLVVASTTTVLVPITRFWRSVRCTMLGVVPWIHFDCDCVGWSGDAAHNDALTGATLNVVPPLVSVKVEYLNEFVCPSTDSCLGCISTREMPESDDWFA